MSCDITNFRKHSEKLGQQYKQGIPIEVVPMAYVPIQHRIEDNYGGDVKIRMAIAKAVNINVISYIFVYC